MGRAADVAQLAEHPICNRAVASSILAVSSVSGARDLGGVPKWLNGADCKSAGYGLRRFESYPHHHGSSGGNREEGGASAKCIRLSSVAGVAQLVERKPSKLDVAGSSPVSRSGGRRPVVRQ